METKNILDIAGYLLLILLWFMIYKDYEKALILSVSAGCFGVLVSSLVISLLGKNDNYK